MDVLNNGNGNVNKVGLNISPYDQTIVTGKQ